MTQEGNYKHNMLKTRDKTSKACLPMNSHIENTKPQLGFDYSMTKKQGNINTTYEQGNIN
jgi:hypothetical protein